MAKKKAKKKKKIPKIKYGAWKKYEKAGDSAKSKGKSCPKCGSGFNLAPHQGRLYCGACHYTEFLKAEKKEPKKEEKK